MRLVQSAHLFSGLGCLARIRHPQRDFRAFLPHGTIISVSFFKNMQVLVTGGAGFIGSNLCLRLAHEGAHVTAVDAFLPGLGANEANLDGIAGINLLKLDISKSAEMEAHVRSASVIFNLAGNVSHQDSMRDPIFDNEVNTRAQISLLETCRRVNPNAIVVFSSTRQLYGAPKYLPVDEAHPVNPIDVNGINKLAAENYHSLYARVYGMRVVCLRLTNTYGPRQLIKHARQGFIGWFMNRALVGEEILLYGGGSQVRDFTYVDDAVEAFLLAAKVPACYGGTFNLSGERASLEEVAASLVRIMPATKIKKVDFPVESKKIDIGDYYGNSERFYSATRWQPRTNLAEGLGHSLAYFKARLPSYLSTDEGQA